MTTEKQPSPITPQQCRMARAALSWSLEDLAAAAGVGRATIHRFENTGEVKPSTIQQMREAFEAKRVQFVESGPYAGAVYGGMRSTKQSD